jgi:hypothetical protein
MGWKIKAFLAFVGFFLLGTGLWFLAIPLFAYLVYSVLPGRRGRSGGRTVVVSQQGSEGDGAVVMSGTYGRKRARSGFEWHWRYLLGVLLLLGALFALGAQGTYSPIVLGGLGLLCLLWGPVRYAAMGGRGSSGLFAPAAFAPVRESILLTPRLIPFVWAAVVEVKFSSQESTRALAVLRDNLIITSMGAERPGAFLEVRVVAPSYRSAEAKVIERLRRMAALLAGRGAYLLPLDSQEAVERFGQPTEPVKLELDESIVAMIGHSHYDVLVIKPDGSHARALGAYTRVAQGAAGGGDGGTAELEAMLAAGAGGDLPAPGRTTTTGTRDARGRAALPRPRQRFHREPLLWEVVSSLQERVRFSDPDSYTTLLNNMHVGRNVPLSQKLNLANGGGAAAAGAGADGTTLMVESLGGTPVKLSRTQLRAIVRVYA